MSWIVEVNPPWNEEQPVDQWVPVFKSAEGAPDPALSTFERFTDATALKASLDWQINAGLTTQVFGTGGPRETRVRELAE